MAQLANLGVPFGAPSRIFNISAPIGSERAGRGLEGLGQIIGGLIALQKQKEQKELLGQDIQAAQQFQQGQQQFGQQGPMLPQVAQSLAQSMGGGQLQAPVSPLTGQPFISQPEFPTPQSNLFQRLTAQDLFQQQTAPDPFTLSPGQTRFGPRGRQIASLPAKQITKPPPTKIIGDELFERNPTTGKWESTGIKGVKPKAGKLIVAKDNDPTGLPQGTVYQQGPQGDIRVIHEPGDPDRLSNSDKSRLAVSEAKEFRKDKRIENLQIVERSERGMQAALKQSTSPNVKSRIASDQALGVLFQKMLDPTSVVRESEYARTPQGASLVNRVLGAAEQLVRGGLSLKNEDRQALVEMAQKLLDEAKITANKAFDEFEVRADELGLNKKIIFGNAKKFDITTPIPDSVLNTQQATTQGLTPQEEAEFQSLLQESRQ